MAVVDIVVVIVVDSILLVGVAILSLYSVHLLLMTSKEGGVCNII